MATSFLTHTRLDMVEESSMASEFHRMTHMRCRCTNTTAVLIWDSVRFPGT